MSLVVQGKISCKCSGKNVHFYICNFTITRRTPSTGEDHVIWSKAPEKRPDEPRGEIVSQLKAANPHDVATGNVLL